MNEPKHYDSNLAMGLGLIDETKALIGLWEPGLSAHQLSEVALSSGLFPGVSAYRLRNIVVRCFAGRYLVDEDKPARVMKRLMGFLSAPAFSQLAFIYTCRANLILRDFITQVYWPQYAGGARLIKKETPEEFIRRAIDDGKTPTRWAEGQIERVGRYLSGCCADFGLLTSPEKGGRSIRAFRPEWTTIAYLSHELHYRNYGDNALLAHPDWELFGLTREDVLEEIKRLALKGLVIVQAAGDVIRVSWKHDQMEALCDVLAQS